MRVLVPGHVYEVANVDDEAGGTQRVEFVQRRDGQGEPLAFARRRPGVLAQELIRVLVDRTLYLYAEAPCDEDTKIIEALRRALTLYESRAARRSLEKLAKPEEADVCPRCNHVLCLHQRKLHPLAPRDSA